MRPALSPCSLVLLLALAATRVAAAETWLSWLSPALRAVEREQAALRAELASLGTPVVGQTVPEFGYTHPRLPAPPPASPWVQVDLSSAQPLDWIALVPAQVDWQPVGGPAYGFPRRFRIDASDDPEFATFTPLAVFTDSDYPEPGVAPVAIRAHGHTARYVRVTVTKLAVENAQHFFALAELQVVSGRRNLAIGRPVRASAAVNLPPRWSPANLVDGRTPLGPPVARELLPYDGLYAGEGPLAPASPPLAMSVDLGRAFPLQEIRVHPVHARLGADIPGFAFPSRFRVEASLTPDFTGATSLLDTGETDFANPGNNPITVRAEGVTARYVRFTMLAPARTFNRQRFGLSEIEVFSDDINVARTGIVTSPPDPSSFSRTWPVAQLIDGYTSYGRLVELPTWLAGWQRRSTLRTRLDALAHDQQALATRARSRAAWAGAALGLTALTAGIFLLAHQRRRRARELEQFRTRLARDLHDEIGSNLAGLAVLSESLGDAPDTPPAAREDWREVNRIARDTTDAMREVLWVVGAREEAGLELTEQLSRAATRMLAGRTVRWTTLTAPSAAAWPAEARRHAFLLFKEALANAARHSGATAFTLSAEVSERVFTLTIADHGRGFDPATATPGIGLASLRDRARALGGEFTLVSSPGAGTRVSLRVPLPSPA